MTPESEILNTEASRNEPAASYTSPRQVSLDDHIELLGHISRILLENKDTLTPAQQTKFEEVTRLLSQTKIVENIDKEGLDMSPQVAMQQIEKITNLELFKSATERLLTNPKLNEEELNAYLRLEAFVLESVTKNSTDIPSLIDKAFSAKHNSRALEVATMSPVDFFDWFDRSLPMTSQQELRDILGAWIKKQIGKTYGSLQANQQMAKGLRKRMGILKVWFSCPGGKIITETGQREKCGKPARIVCAKNPTYEQGAFRLEHADQNITKHGFYEQVPNLVINENFGLIGRRKAH